MIAISSAQLLRFAGHATLELTTPDGLAYLDTPKLLFLRARFAVLWGPDVESGRVPTETIALPIDPEDGRPYPQDYEHATQDPVVVHLASMMALGELQEGAVAVPSLQEVEATLWDFTDGLSKRTAAK